MSVEALTWALNLAPVPVDSNGKPNDSCAFVLVGLANHAGPDGRGAFPSVRTLMRYTRKSERTVRAALARLEAEGLIRAGDPDIVAAHIKRADRRPRGWDLAVERVRTDLDPEELETLEAQFPGIRARVAAARADQVTAAEEPGAEKAVETAVDKAVDTRMDGVRPPHPVDGTGCNQRRNGVQPLQSRGAATAPEPYLEPPKEPPPARTRACASAREASARQGGGAGSNKTADDRISEILGSLGSTWPLTTGQRRRLAEPVQAALAAGWTPAVLARDLAANPDGVRAPYAVLRSRLADLADSAPAAQRPARPEHCGVCVDATRQRETADGRPYPCPSCHPDPGRRARGAEVEAAQLAASGGV